jgi:hypothetical protein
MLWKRSK